MNDKWKDEVLKKSTLVPSMLQENLKRVRVCIKNDTSLLRYSLKWSDLAKHIKVQM